MAWTGDYLSVVSEIMNERIMDDIYADAVERVPMFHRLSRKSDKKSWAGKWAKLLLQDEYNFNAVPRSELEDVILPTPDSFAEMRVYLKQYMSSIGWTQEEAEDAVLAGSSAAIDLVERKIAQAPGNMRRALNAALCGDGTGRLARVASFSETSAEAYGTVTVDNQANEFGWRQAERIYDGMLVDILAAGNVTTGFPTASTWTAKALKCKVSNVIHNVTSTTSTFVITVVTNDSGSSLGTSGNVPADGHFVFLHNSVKCTAALALGSAKTFSSWQNTPGIWALIDDDDVADGDEFHNGASAGLNGSWYGKTIQNVDRTAAANGAMRSFIWKASDWAGGTDGTATTCDIREIQKRIRMIDEQGPYGGLISALYMNGNTRDWLAWQAAATQNAFQPSNSGKITPGIYTESMRTSSNRMVDIVTMDSLADGHIMGICEDDLIWFDKIPIGWHILDGNKIFTPPGARNLTKESWLRTRMALAIGCAGNSFRMEDIDISA